MPMSDVFTPDAFGLMELTTSINKLPYNPKRLGQMGIFKPKGVSTRNVVIEEKQGVLSLLPAVSWGGPATSASHGDRKAMSLLVPHFPYEDAVLASEIQDVRLFGSNDQSEGVNEVVNDKLEAMKNTHEATKEYLRIGALHGILLDGAGTTLFNLFTQFNVSPPSDLDFVLGTAGTKVINKCLTAKEVIEDAIGDATYDHVHALCGRTWFKAFTQHAEVKYAYQYFQEGKVLREDQRAGFEFGGVIFEQYRGKVGTKTFVADGDARFFPVGVPDLFIEHYAPADFIETVNTIGLPLYAKQETMEFDRGIKLHVQANTLPICTRPACLLRGYTSN